MKSVDSSASGITLDKASGNFDRNESRTIHILSSNPQFVSNEISTTKCRSLLSFLVTLPRDILFEQLQRPAIVWFLVISVIEVGSALDLTK